MVTFLDAEPHHLDDRQHTSGTTHHRSSIGRSAPSTMSMSIDALVGSSFSPSCSGRIEKIEGMLRGSKGFGMPEPGGGGGGGSSAAASKSASYHPGRPVRSITTRRTMGPSDRAN